MSRQAAHIAVDRLVRQGVLGSGFVAGSRRDKIVFVTQKGQRLRALAAQHICEFEGWVAEGVGKETREAHRDVLKALSDAAKGAD